MEQTLITNCVPKEKSVYVAFPQPKPVDLYITLNESEDEIIVKSNRFSGDKPWLFGSAWDSEMNWTINENKDMVTNFAVMNKLKPGVMRTVKATVDGQYFEKSWWNIFVNPRVTYKKHNNKPASYYITIND